MPRRFGFKSKFEKFAFKSFQSRTGTAKAGAIYKAQKAQNFQKLERKQFLRTKNYHLEKSHNAENCKRGTLWAFSTSIQLQKNQKNEGGPLETLILGKKSHSAEKKSKGGTFRHVRFCRFPRKSKK